VAVAEGLKTWDDGLRTLLQSVPANALQDEASRGKHTTPGETYVRPSAAWTLNVGSAAAATLADELTHWGEWDGPLILSRGFRSGEYPPAPSEGWLDGISSLIWITRAKGIDLHLDFSRMRWGKGSSYQSFRSDRLVDLSRALAPNVTTLNLSQNDLTNSATNYAGLHHFCAALTEGRLSGLTALSLAGTQLTDYGGVMVVEALVDLPLETLDLYSGDQGNRLASKTAAAVGSLLTKTKTLTRLNYAYNSLKPGKTQTFAEGLTANCTLTSLDISHTDFGMKQWGTLADALKGTALTDLNVSGCSLRGQGAAATLADLLSHVKLTNLDCAYLEATAEEAELAAAAVVTRTERCGGLSVADMRLGGLTALTVPPSIGQIGLGVVMQLLPLHKGLTTLILYGNNLDVSMLLTPLRQLSDLTRLDLSDTQMDGKGCQALAEILPRTSIMALALNRNSKLGGKGGKAGILALAAVLPDTKLVKLSVKAGHFGGDLAEEAVVALVKAAKACGMEIRAGTTSDTCEKTTCTGAAGSPVSDESMEKYPRGLHVD